MAAKHPLRILLAEDGAVNRKVALMMLSALGYSADSVVNGQEAVEAMSKAQYDLILMDIQMPVMNGIDAAHIIQKTLGAACPVILAVTAQALEGDEERFLGMGFNGYLSKPVLARVLQTALNAVQPTIGTSSHRPSLTHPDRP